MLHYRLANRCFKEMCFLKHFYFYIINEKNKENFAFMMKKKLI